MPIFTNTEGKLVKLRLKSFSNEKTLQKLIEDNLFEVLEMHFLASEYTTTDRGRIDTLAIDANGAPVIIEYKKSKNDTVINQALSYLKWLKAQKKEFFEMLVTKKLGVEKANNIDWSNPRVICIAEGYSRFDMDTVEVIPLRIELYKYRLYENGAFLLEDINNTEEKVDIVRNVEDVIVNQSSVSVELSFNMDFHLQKGTPQVIDLFNILKGKIFELDDSIQERITSVYIAYKMSKNFVEIHIQRNRIALHLRALSYHDPENKVNQVPDSHRWTLDKRIYISNEADVDYVMPMIEQSYKDVL